ncbi:hypothetical protein LCI18_004662 [Fusarium solani-melongenae]|uniref:Uncharacterized protein n=1 Tax=Fusarium solani subsp. cucurbitae TaxID=2747967 RepID=A0ACD3YXY2_FUSSC|nr:hypothetical protein LCI18_004662 [Fusarium solani-melongenae]
MSSPNRARTAGWSKRLTVSGGACIRCRQKKKRCDQKLPKCRLCEQAGVECLGYDAAAVRQVPRSYIQDLEDRVAYLEQKLQEQNSSTRNLLPQPSDLHFNPETPSPGLQLQGNESNTHGENVSSTGSLENSTRNAAKAAAEVINLSPRVPGGEPAFSRLFLSDLMRNMAKPQLHRSQLSNHPPREEEAPFSDIMGGLQDAGPTTLPSRETAQNLVKMYFRLTNLGMPLLHEAMLQEKLDLLYDLPRKIDLDSTHTTTESRIATFFVLEVFATALLVVQEREPSGRWLADRYSRTALAALNKAGLPSNIQGIQALLLIGQHAYHHPTLWNAWKTVGAALRLAVELGLHQDPPPGTTGFMELDNMRRTFWVAYAMDRNVSTSLCLPCCLSDGAITAKFPSDAKDEYITADMNGYFLEEQISGSKRITLHLYRYRRIQSEIRRALHEEPFLPTDSSSLDAWQQQMHGKIETWYQTTPDGSNLTTEEKDVIETFEVTYNTALFSLYRPSPNIPSPSETQLLVMVQAATKMIHLYRRFFRQHKLTIYWQAVENVSSAGLALLFGHVQSSKVRESMPLGTLNSLVHLCSSLLWGMVERFPSARGKRDAFDAASSQVLADLNGGAATVGENLSLFGQISSNWTGHGCQPVSTTAREGTHLDPPAHVTAPDNSAQASQTESTGANVNGSAGDYLTDSDILTWMLEPIEGAPGTLPMTWM